MAVRLIAKSVKDLHDTIIDTAAVRETMVRMRDDDRGGCPSAEAETETFQPPQQANPRLREATSRHGGDST
jgi:hypothetical protein